MVPHYRVVQRGGLRRRRGGITPDLTVPGVTPYFTATPKILTAQSKFFTAPGKM